MDSEDSTIRKRYYSAALCLVRNRVESVEDDENELLTQLKTELGTLKETMTSITDIPFNSAVVHLETALIHTSKRDIEQSSRHFWLCDEELLKVLGSVSYFKDKCLAARLRMITRLYVNEFFTADSNLATVQCRTILNELLSDSEITRSVHDEFETKVLSFSSRKARIKLFFELSDCLYTFKHLFGNDPTACDPTLKLTSIKPYVIGSHKGNITCLAYSNSCLYSGAWDNTIKVWDLSTLTEVATLNGHSLSVSCIVCSGGVLYSGSYDGTIKVWNLNTLSEIATLSGNSGAVCCLSCHNGRLFAGTYNAVVKVWDLSSLHEIASLSGHRSSVWAVAFSGERLYSGAQDGAIKVWDLTTWTIIATLGAHEDKVNSLVCGDGRLYSASNDKSILVWDLVTLERLSSCNVHRTSIISLIYHEGKLYSGSDSSICETDLNTLSNVNLSGAAASLLLDRGKLFSACHNEVQVRFV